MKKSKTNNCMHCRYYFINHNDTKTCTKTLYWNIKSFPFKNTKCKFFKISIRGRFSKLLKTIKNVY